MAEDQGAGAETESVEADVAVAEGGEESSVVGSVVTDGAYTLFAADFSDIESAWEAYEALKSIEDGRHVEIEGVVVVKREADGTLEVQKATDHSTKRGLAWGVVGGVVLALLAKQGGGNQQTDDEDNHDKGVDQQRPKVDIHA